MDEYYKKIAKKTRKNVLNALRFKLFNIMIIPYDSKHKSTTWNVSSLTFTLCLLFFIGALSIITYSAGQLIYLNYKINKLELQNKVKKEYIYEYEKQLREYIVEYAPKKNYVESQTVFLPTNNKKQLNIGGNEIKWDKDNSQMLEAYYKKIRDEVDEEIINSKQLFSHLDTIESSLIRSEDNAGKISKLFRENRKSISSLPLSWPIKDGLGEIVENSSKNILHILTIPGSIIVPTGQGIVKTITYNENSTATIVISHSFGITSKYSEVFNPKVKVGDEISRKNSIGETGKFLKYEIAINNKPISAKDFSFLRY